MTAPFEIIAGAVDVYLAPVATAFPTIAAAPAGTWVKLGASGSKNITEKGVTVQHEQNIEEIFGLGATGPLKAFRTREGLIVRFTLQDATMESYSAAMNSAAVTTTAGPPAEKSIPLLRGTTVTSKAMLIRGVMSPYADSVNNVQWELPVVYQGSEPETIYVKGEAVALEFEFHALQDATLGFGTLRAPTA